MKKIIKYILIVIILAYLMQNILTYLIQNITLIKHVFNSFFNEKNIENIVKKYKIIGPVILSVIITITIIVPGPPTAIFLILSATLYGTLIGFFINIISVFIGNVLSVFLFKELETLNKNKKNIKFIKEFYNNNKNNYLSVAIGYLIPIIPTSLINIYISKLEYKSEEKLKLIFISMLPFIVVYTYSGYFLRNGNIPILLVIIVIIYLIYRIYNTKK